MASNTNNVMSKFSPIAGLFLMLLLLFVTTVDGLRCCGCYDCYTNINDYVQCGQTHAGCFVNITTYPNSERPNLIARGCAFECNAETAAGADLQCCQGDYCNCPSANAWVFNYSLVAIVINLIIFSLAVVVEF